MIYKNFGVLSFCFLMGIFYTVRTNSSSNATQIKQLLEDQNKEYWENLYTEQHRFIGFLKSSNHSSQKASRNAAFSPHEIALLEKVIKGCNINPDMIEIQISPYLQSFVDIIIEYDQNNIPIAFKTAVLYVGATIHDIPHALQSIPSLIKKENMYNVPQVKSSILYRDGSKALRNTSFAFQQAEKCKRVLSRSPYDLKTLTKKELFNADIATIRSSYCSLMDDIASIHRANYD